MVLSVYCCLRCSNDGPEYDQCFKCVCVCVCERENVCMAERARMMGVKDESSSEERKE